jgi:hypothetical protein
VLLLNEWDRRRKTVGKGYKNDNNNIYCVFLFASRLFSHLTSILSLHSLCVFNNKRNFFLLHLADSIIFLCCCGWLQQTHEKLFIFLFFCYRMEKLVINGQLFYVLKVIIEFDPVLFCESCCCYFDYFFYIRQ